MRLNSYSLCPIIIVATEYLNRYYWLMQLFSRRDTIRSAHAIEFPKSTLFRILKEGKSIKRVSSTIEPFLTEKNKKDCVEFCLSKVLPDAKVYAL